MSGPSFDYLRALIIEDNNHMRTLLRSLMQALGIKQVIECADGASGYVALREKSPDFVLTDLSMKPIDGIEFTKMVRNAKDSPNPYVPIIMVTGPYRARAGGSGARCRRHRIPGQADHGAEPCCCASPKSSSGRGPSCAATAISDPTAGARSDPNFAGPWRRHDDYKDDIAIQ